MWSWCSFSRFESVARLGARAGVGARRGMGATGAAALAAALLALSSAGVAAEEVSSVNVIEFRTTVNNDRGVVRCGLFRQQGWLKEPIRGAIAKIQGRSALCVFNRVPNGVYGISGFHDENSNGKLDTNAIGMPTEDYCASRNARGTFGPPSFEDAKFAYSGGTKRLEARMK
ncbi:MAG TPA: DUF2141 domain-containing protein [Polyangiaceae bacterium]|nr:DUF2141 domain-containing protein [Polyangiaceae bacterium]